MEGPPQPARTGPSGRRNRGGGIVEPVSRRAVSITCGAAGFAVVGLAAAPWTISPGWLQAAVARQLRVAYGLELTVSGRSTIAFLPVPRLKFEDVALADADGAPLVRGGRLRGEFRIVRLLAGTVELSELALDGARIDVDLDAAGRTAWTVPLERVKAAPADSNRPVPHLRRLSVAGSHLVLRDRRSDREAVVRDINLTVTWPAAESAAEVQGSFVWLGEPVTVAASRIRPRALLAGRSTPFDVLAEAAPGRIRLSGDASLGDDPRVVGRLALETRSLRDFLRWSGIRAPLGALRRAVAIEGDFTADRRSVACPAVRLTLGEDRLDGALTVRFARERPLATGTLAADRLDLSDLVPALGPAQASAAGWSTEPIDLAPLTAGADLDLRLSAARARLGRLGLEDMAANLMVKPGRIEATLSRATLAGGVTKGRLHLATGSGGLELRAQGSFDRLDAGALLGDLGLNRWLTGSAQGQFTLEASGDSAAELVRQSRGRATVTVRSAELVGLNLADVLRRAERQPAATWTDVRGGRTPLEDARVSVTLGNGVLEIADGALVAANARATLHGRASLAEPAVALRATVEAGPGAPADAPSPVALQLSGPLDDLTFAAEAAPSGPLPSLFSLDARARAGRPPPPGQ